MEVTFPGNSLYFYIPNFNRISIETCDDIRNSDEMMRELGTVSTEYDFERVIWLDLKKIDCGKQPEPCILSNYFYDFERFRQVARGS